MTDQTAQDRRAEAHAEAKAHERLDYTDEHKAEEEAKVNAKVTHEVVRREGKKELERSLMSLGLSALAGGLAIGLAVVTKGALHHALPEAPWRHLVTAFGYPVGFLAVILGSQHLYTENTLTPVVPMLSERSRGIVRKVFALWGIVLLVNLVGAFLFAWAAARTAMLPPEIRQSIHTLSLEGVNHDWGTIFARGIVAGWVIALMVWMLPAASASQVLVIIIMTWLIGAAKLAHVIVGAVEAFYLLVLQEISIGHAFGGFILPALLGNTIGGVGLVAALNHAQVETE